MSQSKQFKIIEKNNIDRLSSLPDSILVKILSLLPIKSAVITSVLSHQWHYLWTHITNFVFTPTCLPSSPPDFSAAVNHILPRLTSTNISRFYLFLGENSNDFSNIESWIRNICTRNPEQIVVETNLGCDFRVNNLPAVILQCQSLVELSLIGDISIKFPDDVGFVATLPKLKKLHLFVDSDKLARIFKCCPLLEDLNLSIDYSTGINERFIDLSVNNIKKLIISTKCNPGYYTKFVINVSNLEEFTLLAPALGWVRFIGDYGALINADILIFHGVWKKNNDDVSIAAELAKLISSVKSLNIDLRTLTAVSSLQNELVPVFDNLSLLRIVLDDRFGRIHRDTLVLLRRSLRCLEVLRFEIEYFWSAAHIDDADIRMVEYILNFRRDLKSISICYVNRSGCNHPDVESKEYEFCEKLFGVENPSGYEIEFNGQYARYSNTNFVPRRQSIRLANKPKVANYRELDS